MPKGDENIAPANKKNDKNIVSQLCAQYEVKTPRIDPTQGVIRAKKVEGGSRTPKTSTTEDVSRKSLRIDSSERSSTSSEDQYLSVTPSTPGPISPSRLPFKRIHTEELGSFVKEKAPSFQGSLKRPKVKSLGKKESSDAVMTVIRFRPGGSETCGDLGERSAYEEDGVVVMKAVDKKDSVRYTFDEVCAEHITQDEMFERAARRMTDDFLDGYNATIFAYGQTGSGKTHTMLGDLNLCSNQRGITPRVFSHVFDTLETKHAEGLFELKVSFMQIYNEKCQDLINPAVNTKIGHVEEDLKIRESPEGVFVEGLSKTVCKNAEQALECVAKGIRNRKTGKTAMNTVSSRSHSILTLELTGNQYVSRLNLIDLAGSENQKTSAASSATQQNEANNINRSLTYLGQCLREAVKDPEHVNYRNSKLTKLLKDCLGGTAKTCVIATVSAMPAFASETASTLKFASNIKLIQTQAVRHFVKGGQNPLELEVARLKQELRFNESEAQAKLEAQAAAYEIKLAEASRKGVFGDGDSNAINHTEGLQAAVRNLEVELAMMVQSKHQEAEEFTARLAAKDEEIIRYQTDAAGFEKEFAAQVHETRNAYGSLERQMNGKAGAHTLELEHAKQVVQSSQRVIEELQLSLQSTQASLQAALIQKTKFETEVADVQADLRFMIEKEANSQAKVADLEQEIVKLRTAETAANLREAERGEEQTIRRLAAEKHTASENETIKALQLEILRLQANAQSDLLKADELRAQVNQLQDTLTSRVQEEVEAQTQQLKAELEAKTAQLNKQRKECSAHTTELTQFRFQRKSTTTLEQEHKTCKNEISKVKAENVELLKQNQQLSQQLNQERNEQDELCRFARNTEGEKHRALLEKIEADFGGKLPLGNQARLFIRNGILNRVSAHGKLLEYNFFLFTDVLIYASAAKAHAQGKFKAHRVIHLGLCRLVDIQPRPDSEANTLYSNSFRLITPQKSDAKDPRNRGFYISCDTPAEKQSWMQAIGAQIEKIYSQPEGTVVQVPRVADVSAPERMMDGENSDYPSVCCARSSFSVCEEERKETMRSRECSLDFNEESKGESLEEAGGLSWAVDDPNRPRATSNESVVSRSRAGSVSSSVFSRMTEFTAADLPTSHTSLMRARVQAHDYCRLCVRPFSTNALNFSRHKATCGCCDDKNICKGCCNSKAVPPRSLDGKERKVCLACHGGITRLVGRGIPRLSVEYE